MLTLVPSDEESVNPPNVAENGQAPLAAMFRPGRVRKKIPQAAPQKPKSQRLYTPAQPLPRKQIDAALESLCPDTIDPLWAGQWALSLVTERAKKQRAEGGWFTQAFGVEHLAAYEIQDGSREADFLREVMQIEPPARLLDLGCGYGRLAIPLARAGFDVVGLDLSLPMLEQGLALAQAEGLSIQFVHGDMRDVNFDATFAGVYCMDHTFGFFDDAENIAMLRGIYNSLQIGGRVVIDLVNRDVICSDVPKRTWFEGKSCLIQEDIELDEMESRLNVRRYLVFADGKDRIYDISLRLYTAHELCSILSLAGFEVEELSGSIHTRGAYFPGQSERLIAVGVKR